MPLVKHTKLAWVNQGTQIYYVSYVCARLIQQSPAGNAVYFELWQRHTHSSKGHSILDLTRN